MSKYARYNSPLDLGVTFCEDGNDEYWYPDDPDRNVIFRCPRTPPEGYKMTQEEWEKATWLCLEARIHPTNNKPWFGDITNPIPIEETKYIWH